MGQVDARSASTIRTVAKAAGVSAATAARALGGYGTVSEVTRERVRRSADELGYRPNGVARSMITGTTRTLGLVVADIENPFFASASRGFADQARAEGFDVLIANTDEDIDTERSVVKALLEKRVDGLVIAPATWQHIDHLEASRSAGHPVVLLDRQVPSLSADSVLVDSRKAADVAVTHLIEAGHRDIAIVTGASPEERHHSGAPTRHLMSTGRERIQGYGAALRRAGIPIVQDYLQLGDFHREAAGKLALELLRLPAPPTAIFTTDAVITLGVIEALQSADVRLPEEMSVIGFDDPYWSTVVRPKLTVVTQPVYELGALAAERLIARIRGDESRTRRRNLPTTLVVRDSVTAPRSIHTPAGRP